MFGRIPLWVGVGIVSASCWRGSEPALPAEVAPPPAADADALAPRGAGPRYLVGETCVAAPLSMPHLFPLFAGGDVAWTADESFARAPLNQGTQWFTVLGFEGAPHGQIATSVDGSASDARGFVGRAHFTGGGGPCAHPQPDGSRIASLGCGAAGGCGISVAIVGDTKPPSVAVGSVCWSDGSLIGDFDGDGAAEAFAVEEFRKPGAVNGASYAGALCAQPHFAWYRLPVETGVVDLLGVADLDRDGHFEVIMAYTPAGGTRTVTLYSATPGAARRLERRASIVR